MENKIAVLFDLENVVFGRIWANPEKFSWKAGFDRLLAWLNSVGKVSMFCIFFPAHFLYQGLLLQADLEYFWQKGFFPIVCPKIGPQNEDTTDFTLIKWGKEVLFPHLSGITHLCIGSGDIDFIGLQMEAQKRGLKLMITVGYSESLSGEVKKKADLHPQTGKPMIHYFIPYEE